MHRVGSIFWNDHAGQQLSTTGQSRNRPGRKLTLKPSRVLSDANGATALARLQFRPGWGWDSMAFDWRKAGRRMNEVVHRRS